MMQRTFRWLLLVVASGLAGGQVLAHPHSWIDLESIAIIDEENRLVALEQTWLFGNFYSNYVLSEVDTSDKPALIQYLREVNRQNLVSLREHDYFTVIRANGKKQLLADVDDFETGVIDGRIYLKITTRLAQPVNVVRMNVEYAVFDPSYYIEVLHGKGSRPSIRNASSWQCALRVMEPSPTFDQLAYASSLDTTENEPGGLGEVFAEWVALSCP